MSIESAAETAGRLHPRPSRGAAQRERADGTARRGRPRATPWQARRGRRAAPRLRRADQAADHLAAAADDGGGDVRRRSRRARRSRRSCGRCSAATSPPAAPGRSTTTSTASATRAWRARARRPLVCGRIEPLHGLVFGIVLGALAVVQLAITVNVLAAALSLAGPARLRLRLHAVAEAADAAEHRHRRRRRRRAAAGRLGRRDRRRSTARRALPFAIVFLWTPPHFWALALLIKDDYARTGVPMLPVVRGEDGDAPPDPRLRACSWSRSRCCPSRPACSATALPGRRARARRRLHRPRRVARSRTPRAAPRCASTSPRSPTSRCCSARWRVDRVGSDRRRRRGSRRRSSTEPPRRALRRPRIAICVFGARLRVRDQLHRLMADHARNPEPDRARLRARALVGSGARSRSASPLIVVGLFAWWPYWRSARSIVAARAVRPWIGGAHRATSSTPHAAPPAHPSPRSLPQP